MASTSPKFLIVVPARLNSTRLPDKPMQLLDGEPLIVRVVRRILSLHLPGLVGVQVASDSEEVLEAVLPEQPAAVHYSDSWFVCGTERAADAYNAWLQGHGPEVDVVVNVQADLPFISEREILGAVHQAVHVHGKWVVGTAVLPLEDRGVTNKHRVKAFVSSGGECCLFTRGAAWTSRRRRWPMPFEHVGVYAYHPSALWVWAEAPVCALEKTLRLEQARYMTLGGVLRADISDLIDGGAPPPTFPRPFSIDTPEDLVAAQEIPCR